MSYSNITKKLIIRIKNFKLSTDDLIFLSFIILIFVSLFGTSLPFQGGTYEEIFEEETTNLSNQVIYLFLFFMSLIPLFRRYDKIFSFLSKEKFLSVFIFLCLISAFWSQESFISFKRSFQLLITFLVLLNSVLFLDYNTLLKPLKIIIPLYLIINLFSCLIIPQAIDSASAWKGIHGHKNGLAQSTYYLFLVSTFLDDKRQNLLKKLYLYSIYLLSIILIYKAQSSTIIIVFILTIGYGLIKQFEKLFGRLNVGRFIIVFLLSFMLITSTVVIYFSSDIIALVPQLFGKDMSISGREPIWGFVISEIAKKPLLGYGFSTYWIMGGSVVDVFASEFGGFKINQAHNGYLEIILQLGLVGLFFFLILLIVFLFRAIKIKKDLPIIILSSLLIINYTESILFQPKGICTVVFITTYLIINRLYFKTKLLKYTSLNYDL